MYRTVLLISIALSFAACTEERVIYDNSPNAKFAAMMGGKRDGEGDVSGAWQVSNHTSPNKPASAQAQRIAELIRGQLASPKPLPVPADNPGNYKVTTSFDLADQPNSPNAAPTLNTSPYMGVPNLNPPTATPVAPNASGTPMPSQPPAAGPPTPSQ